jgi:ribosome maturation factor RimP
MITKKQIAELINSKLKEDGFFIVDVKVKPSNRIEVFIDSDKGVPVDYCVEVSRFIEHSLDRDAEDFELQVSSPGIGQPFKVIEQYHKAIGLPLEVLTNDGRLQQGVLKEVSETGFVIEEEKKVKIEGGKKKELQLFRYEFSFDEVKRVRELLKL